MKKAGKRKIVHVVAGVLVDRQGRIFLAQRPKGKKLAGLWEFPGGKLEDGETPEDALVRELKEELGIRIDKKSLTPLTFISHPYADFHLVMPVFICRKWTGKIAPTEGQAVVWIRPADIGRYPLPPADMQPHLLRLIHDVNKKK